jgi:hypothetical protein
MQQQHQHLQEAAASATRQQCQLSANNSNLAAASIAEEFAAQQ